jgi:hypothetical protein
MNSATVAYWFPVSVNDVQEKPRLYEGYSATAEPPFDPWISQALDIFEQIYGSVIDCHYVVESVRLSETDNYDFILSVVVTAMVDSEADLEDKSRDHWPKDIVEQLRVTAEERELPEVVGYDYNPICSEPIYTKLNYQA